MLRVFTVDPYRSESVKNIAVIELSVGKSVRIFLRIMIFEVKREVTKLITKVIKENEIPNKISSNYYT